MNVFEKMVSTQTILFIYLFVGFLIHKTGLLTAQSRSYFVKLLINVTLPCMIVHSFCQDVSFQQLMNAWQALLISTFCILGAYVLGAIVWRKKEGARQSVLRFATMFSNQGYAGMAVIALVFGQEGVFYTAFILVPVRILIWTLGASLFVKQQGRDSIRSLLTNPSVVAVPVGLVLLLLHIQLPAPVATAIGSLGDMTAPMSMMVVGSSLAEIRPRDVLDRDVFSYAAVRLLLAPLLTLAALRLLNAPLILVQVETVLMAMPAPTNAAILAEMYGSDHRFAAKCIFISTILSLFTVPCITLLF